MKQFILSISFIVLISYTASAQTKIAAKDAKMHINETVTFTGKIYSGKFFASNNITLLDLGGYNPNQELTIMIPATGRGKFTGKPEDDLRGKEVTVTGMIIDYKGKPEMLLNDPTQIKVLMTDNVVPIPVKVNP
jgi:DNA/RNA endonuclease YhcR with UshA esterase domain